MRRREGAAVATISAVNSCKAAESERRSVSNCRFSRQDITATPWSPTEPDTITTSPGRARFADSVNPSGTTPIPAVEMNTPSALPRSTTFVSPATIGTPALRDASPMESAMRLRSASANPSSRMKLAVSFSGRAPDMAMSLIVPCTASEPMSPPGKNSGEIT